MGTINSAISLDEFDVESGENELKAEVFIDIKKKINPELMQLMSCNDLANENIKS